MTTNTFTIQVLDSVPSTNITDHNFVSAAQNSITKQGVDRAYYDLGVGVAITDIQSDQVGVAHGELFLSIK